MPLAGTPSKVTVVPTVKPLPVIVTVWPPDVGPAVGDSIVAVGATAAVT